MARIFTTPEQVQSAKVWLHDLILSAGLISNSQRAANSDLSGFVQYCRTETKAVCDELVNRDFTNIDHSLKTLANYRVNLETQAARGNWKKLRPDFLARSVVYMAELLNIYWDDTIRTPYEIDEFKKTLLGAAVFKYGRYISAISDKTKKKTTSSRTSGQPPKNNYKQSGPQSGNVRDLQDLNGGPGTPGHKVTASTNLIYKIIGDNPTSKNTPNVFIKPLSAAGATGNTNKIFISSGNGYTDCTCYFDDPNDANAFLNKIVQANRVPSNVTNLRVVKNKADANGYFLVGTEFGVCAVSAKTLNEALTEALSDVNGWEKATKDYSKAELEELHTWMRKD